MNADVNFEEKFVYNCYNAFVFIFITNLIYGYYELRVERSQVTIPSDFAILNSTVTVNSLYLCFI